jgi:lysophospholipase L1-like esterase
MHRVSYLTLFLAVLSLALLSTGLSSAVHPRSAYASAAFSRSQAAKVLPARKRAYAALGASETFGVGASPYTKGYAFLVKQGLHAKHFVDTGIPGTTLPAGFDAELNSALAIRPALATVFFGFNDIKGGVSRVAFLSNLTDLVTTLQRAHAKVLIIDLPDLSLLPAVVNSGIPGVHEITISWNNGMRRVAQQTGAQFLELAPYSHELATHPAYIAVDGLHPSNAGHARLAQIVLAAIRSDHLWPTNP